MSYLLEIAQADRRQMVGVFDSEEHVLHFMERIPFIHKEITTYGAGYTLPFQDLPELYEINYRGWVYPLSRSSFSSYESDGDIEFLWHEIQDFDRRDAKTPTFCEGFIHVDGYDFPAEEAVAYIGEREALYAEAKAYWGANAQRNALGSQDGEYVEADGHLFFLLDGAAIALRKKCGSFEEFLNRYEKGDAYKEDGT